MKTETITYLKEHANTFELNEQLLLTKNGKPALSCSMIDSRQNIQQALFDLNLSL